MKNNNDKEHQIEKLYKENEFISQKIKDNTEKCETLTNKLKNKIKEKNNKIKHLQETTDNFPKKIKEILIEVDQ